MIYNNITIGGEIYHHGVKGMKWGVRRYQPYGTGYKGSSGKFVGEINKQSGYTLKKSDEEIRKRRDKYLKTAITGTAFIGISLILDKTLPQVHGLYGNPYLYSLRKSLETFPKIFAISSATNYIAAGKNAVQLAYRHRDEIGDKIKNKVNISGNKLNK